MVRDLDGRIVEFSFSSRLSPDLSQEVVLQLARRIWSDNVRSGLTGVMVRYGLEVDQLVEGPAALVLPLAARILTDRRHCEIVIRKLGPVPARRSRDWTMRGFAEAADAPPAPLIRVMRSPDALAAASS